MLSRRDFLTHSAAAAALLTLPPERPPLRPRPTCVVLDLEGHCSLRESITGYLACLDDLPVILSEAKDLTNQPRSFASLRMTQTAIIPGASHIDSSTAQSILRCLHQGGTVLLESGAMFGDYPEHRDQLREYFQILVGPPTALWPARGIPYVEYSWPISTKVRDYSRVIPVAPQRGTIIANVRDIPVALARRVGAGVLVFLGSPIGPALWAGDAEAKRWLGELISLGADRQT